MMLAKLTNGSLPYVPAMVAVGWPLRAGGPEEEWTFWLDLVIKILGLILAAFTAHRQGQQTAKRSR